jgi:hypothetical protein
LLPPPPPSTRQPGKSPGCCRVPLVTMRKTRTLTFICPSYVLVFVPTLGI